MSFLQSVLFVCPMVFLASFVDAVSGGGGLISLPAYIFTGMPVHNAYGCNKFSCCVSTALSAARFVKNGIVNLRIAVPMAAVIFASSMAASRIVLLLSDEFLKPMVLFSMPAIAVLILTQRSYPQVSETETLTGRQVAFGVIGCGLVMGFYDGILGPGSGTLAIILCTRFLKFDLTTASGNAKTMVLASALASAIAYILAGKVIWGIAVPATVCGLLGSYLGAELAMKKGARFIRPMMLLIAALLIVKMLSDILGNYI